MRTAPAISVLLPIRNAAATLPACLRSIQSQSFSDFEVVAVDDGSTDGTAGILESFAREDDRVRVITTAARGLVAALNEGLGACSATLIARMDADDVIHPERLAAQLDLLGHDLNIGVVGTQVELFGDVEISEGLREYIRWQNGCVSPDQIATNIYVESPFAHPSVTFRRAVIEQLGGYRDGSFPEDYELWLRCHASGIRMCKIPRVLLFWRDSPQRASRSDDRYVRNAFDRLRADYLVRDPRLLGGRRVVVWGAGLKTRKRTRLSVDRGVELEAWIDIDPRKIGKNLWGKPVHPPSWLSGEDKPFVLVYVTNHGAREEISQALDRMGYVPGSDFLAVG